MCISTLNPIKVFVVNASMMCKNHYILKSDPSKVKNPVMYSTSKQNTYMQICDNWSSYIATLKYITSLSRTCFMFLAFCSLVFWYCMWFKYITFIYTCITVVSYTTTVTALYTIPYFIRTLFPMRMHNPSTSIVYISHVWPDPFWAGT